MGGKKLQNNAYQEILKVYNNELTFFQQPEAISEPLQDIIVAGFVKSENGVADQLASMNKIMDIILNESETSYR